VPTDLRIATFNLENLDEPAAGSKAPSLATRIAVLRPQLVRLRADVLCLQEVNGQEPAAGGPRTLAALDQLIAGTRYATYHRAHTRTQAGPPYDERNLVVLSRFAIQAHGQFRDAQWFPHYRKLTSLPPEAAAKPISWERPVLFAQLDLGGGRVLHLMVVHLKSKLPTDIEGQYDERNHRWRSAAAWAEGSFLSVMKRVGQALEIRTRVDGIFDQQPEAWIAICGDFNAEFDEVTMNALRGPVEETANPALGNRVLVPCEHSVPDSSRYTLWHLGRKTMLDHVLVSRPMLAFYRGAEIHNEVLPDESGAFRTDEKFPESDHAPVVAEFAIP
jgi:endonuclease/exonuclease/phosphatase family metal-dependent hydrolase